MTVDEQLEQLSKALLTLAHNKNRGKLIPGYYAVNDYKSRKLIAIVSPDGQCSERTSQHAREVVAQLMVDPVQAMLDYASITGVCGVCGRKLEDPTSVTLGIGPVCIKRLM